MVGRIAVVAVALFTVLSGSEGAGAQPQAPDRQPPAGPGRMGSMMAGRQTMQAEMEGQAKKLDALVAAMNAAKGDEKVDRVAAVVSELVAQHKAMHARMMAMPMMSQPATGDPAKADPAKPPAAADDHAAPH